MPKKRHMNLRRATIAEQQYGGGIGLHSDHGLNLRLPALANGAVPNSVQCAWDG